MNKYKPVIIKEKGKKLAVFAFTDLDGTVNNQAVLEKDRLATVTPAKEAIQELQNHGIPVGIVTARSFGETMLYQEALGANGFTITEDGAVIILPNNIQENIKKLSQKKHVVTHDKQAAIILSEVELSTIKDFFEYVKEQLAEKRLSQDIVSTCTSSPQALKELIKYQTIDDAKRSADRLASAFVRDITVEQYKVISENAVCWKLRVIGNPHHAHILGKDADKGSAIQFINDNISLFLPTVKDIDGILPVVFGNDYNDLRLFEETNVMGGISVMVKDVKEHYRVLEEEIPSYVMKTDGAYGYGMKEAIKLIFKELEIV